MVTIENWTIDYLVENKKMNEKPYVSGCAFPTESLTKYNCFFLSFSSFQFDVTLAKIDSSD